MEKKWEGKLLTALEYKSKNYFFGVSKPDIYKQWRF